jgi:MSHA pilin protein MshA
MLLPRDQHKDPIAKGTNRSSHLSLGFTLIELIIVITILSILAIMVIPKYIDLTKDSRISVIRGLAASVQEGSSTAAAQCLITPGCFATGMTWLLTIGPGHYQMWNGYPDAGDTVGGNEIDTLISTSNQFSVSINSPDTTLWQLTSAPTPANCAVQYKEAANANTPPIITVLTAGC